LVAAIIALSISVNNGGSDNRTPSTNQGSGTVADVGFYTINLPQGWTYEVDNNSSELYAELSNRVALVIEIEDFTMNNQMSDEEFVAWFVDEELQEHAGELTFESRERYTTSTTLSAQSVSSTNTNLSTTGGKSQCQ
jgi:hypothetical protein